MQIWKVCIFLHKFLSKLVSLEYTALPQHLQKLVLEAIAYTKICRCSRIIAKMQSALTEPVYILLHTLNWY